MPVVLAYRRRGYEPYFDADRYYRRRVSYYDTVQAPTVREKYGWQRPRAGMGDWGAAITEAIAGRDLERLLGAVLSLNDRLIEAVNARGAVLSGYKEAKALQEEALRLFGPPMMRIGLIPVPNWRILPAAMAFQTAKKAVQVFARQVMTLLQLNRVFTEISAALTRAGLKNDANGVDMTTNQIKRFVFETDNIFGSSVPEYGETKRAIASAADKEWMAWGVAKDAYGDPRWLAAFEKAADKVVLIPDKPEPPSALRERGLAEGGLGNPLPVLAVVVIWTVGILSASVLAGIAITRLIPDQNSKAKTARDLLLKAAEQKRQVELAMRQQGKSQAEIDAAKASIDKETEAAVKAIPEPKSPWGFLLVPLGILAAAAIGGKAAGLW